MRKIILLLLIVLVPGFVSAQISHTQIWKVRPESSGSCENGEISADKKYVAIGNSKGEVKIFEFATGKLLRVLDFNKDYNPSIPKDGEVESIYFSFDSKYLAAGGNGHGVKVWRVSDWTEAKYFSGGECDGMAFSPNNLWLAAPTKGTINIYRISDWQKIATVSHGCGVNSIDFSKDSKHMLSASCDKTIKITTTSDWKVIKTISCPSSTKSVRLSPDQTLIASAHSDARATCVWTFPGGSKVTQITHGADRETYLQETVEWTPDSKYVLAGGVKTGYIWFFERNNGWKKGYEIKAHTNRSEYLARVDNYIFSAGKDGYGVLYRLNLGTTSNADPTGSIAQPAAGSSFQEGDDISIQASASDSDGSVAKVEFFNGSTKLGEDASSPYSYNWNNVSAGNYSLTIKVTDNSGRTANSAGVDITVGAGNTSGNLALNRPVTASSVEKSAVPAPAVVDGNLTTRWGSTFSDPQWIYVDLGETYDISRVKLVWEEAFGKDYKIQVSSNTTSWSDIKVVTGNATLNNDWAGLSGTGRYVRILGTARATKYGYSLFELEVYGSNASVASLQETEGALVDGEPLLAYPNPSKGILYVDSQNKTYSEIQLVGKDGKIWFKTSLREGQDKLEIPTKHLQNGLYFLKAKGREKVLSKKIWIEN